MEAVFWFPDSGITGADIEWQTVGDEMAVEQGEEDADPVREGEVSSFNECEPVPANFDGLL